MKITRLGPDNKAPVMMEMTASEANVLYTVCGAIGGDPKGPRGVMDKIYYALSKLNAISVCSLPSTYFSNNFKEGEYHGFESD